MRLAAAVALFLVASAVVAEEPRGCDKFAWDIGKAQQFLAAASETAATEANDRDAGKALSVTLVPVGEARLVLPPERAPKDPASFAGALELGAAKQAATYAITLSAAAWIDIVQDGKYLKPIAYTGALDCAHVRKSVKFLIGPQTFTLQLSGAPSATIDLVVTPAN